MFSCPPSKNKNEDLENWNWNILEVPMSRTSYQFVPLMYELKIGLIRSKQKTEFTYLNHENSIFIVLELELLHPQRKKTGVN